MKHQELKTAVISHYSNGTMECRRCNFKDMRSLSIDHIEGGGTRHIRKVGNLYSWLVKNEYPMGFQVLCMNCQWIKRAENNETAKKHPRKWSRHINKPALTEDYWQSPEGYKRLKAIRKIQRTLQA